MGKKTEKEIEAENRDLAMAIVRALAARGIETIKDKLPNGFHDAVYGALPDQLKARWQRKSMPNQWKVRKAALIPMVEALLKRPGDSTVIHENTDVLQIEDTVDVPQEHTASYTEEPPPVVVHENTPSYTEEGITSEHSVIQDGPYAERTHGNTNLDELSQADERTEASVFSMHTPEIEPDREHPSIQGNTTEDIPEEPDVRTDEPVLPANTPDIQLDQGDHDALLEMLSWWKMNRGAMPTTQPITERPAFKGNRDATKTIRLTRGLARAAERFIKKHRSETGGNFSAWVEMLVFDALGRPDALVDTDDDQCADD